MAMKTGSEEILPKYLELKNTETPFTKKTQTRISQENCRPLSLINRCKSPQQILANLIQYHINHTLTKWDFIPGIQGGFNM